MTAAGGGLPAQLIFAAEVVEIGNNNIFVGSRYILLGIAVTVSPVSPRTPSRPISHFRPEVLQGLPVIGLVNKRHQEAHGGQRAAHFSPQTPPPS